MSNTDNKTFQEALVKDLGWEGQPLTLQELFIFYPEEIIEWLNKNWGKREANTKTPVSYPSDAVPFAEWIEDNWKWEQHAGWINRDNYKLRAKNHTELYQLFKNR